MLAYLEWSFLAILLLQVVLLWVQVRHLRQSEERLEQLEKTICRIRIPSKN